MTARSIHSLLAASVAFAFLSGAAFAQVPPPAPPVETPQAPQAEAPDTDAPSPAESCTVDPANPSAGTSSDDQMLTDQLADCESVLMPQMDGDPDMAAPVPDPDPNTTPVIPPGAVAPQSAK